MSTKTRRLQQRKSMQTLYERRKAEGLCPECGQPKGADTLTCDSHAATDRARHKSKKVVG